MVIKKSMDAFRERMLSKRIQSESSQLRPEVPEMVCDETARNLIRDISKHSTDPMSVGLSVTELFRMSDLLVMKADEKGDPESTYHADQNVAFSKRPRTSDPVPSQAHSSHAAISTASQSKPQTKFSFQSARDKYTAEVS
jgi:hypothetical protein